MTVPDSGAFMVTPERAGMFFSPPPRQYLDLRDDVTGQDYHGLPMGLSGTAFELTKNDGQPGFTPLSGVSVILTGSFGDGSTSQAVYTDANGDFVFSNLVAGNSYNLSATISGYTAVVASSIVITMNTPAMVCDIYFKNSPSSNVNVLLPRTSRYSPLHVTDAVGDLEFAQLLLNVGADASAAGRQYAPNQPPG